jgi:glyoxylase-like metal-dependent hydrolase (beta-lactamase superfamily II)
MPIKPFPDTDNILAIPITLPDYSNLITANVYAVGKGPVTLIDTGPKFPGSLEVIRKGLASAGLAFSDVERIIITHGHIDHMGLAAGIGHEAGHPVESLIHKGDRWMVSSEHYREDTWSEEFRELGAAVNMPLEEMRKLKERFAFFKLLCDPLDHPALLEDGMAFDGDGYELKILYTPGHTPGSICVYEARQKILFTGDHVIKHVTPNPLLQVQRPHLEDPGYQSLKAYLQSLDRVSELDVRFAFTGHGEYVDNLNGLISAYRTHHRERMDVVWHALKKAPRPIYDLIDDVFPFVPEGEVFLAISEIIVHLELLISEGRAELTDDGPPVLYRAL